MSNHSREITYRIARKLDASSLSLSLPNKTGEDYISSIDRRLNGKIQGGGYNVPETTEESLLVNRSTLDSGFPISPSNRATPQRHDNEDDELIRSTESTKNINTYHESIIMRDSSEIIDAEPLINEEEIVNTDDTSHIQSCGSIPSQNSDDDSDHVAIAIAIEDNNGDIEQAVEFDPTLKSQILLHTNRWFFIALFIAICVSITLGILISQDFFQKKRPVLTRSTTPTASPTMSPTNSYQVQLLDTIQTRFNLDVTELKNDRTSYGQAFQWIVRDDWTAKMLYENSSMNITIENIVQQRYFLSLFYFAMSGDGWSNCSAALFPSGTQECYFTDRDGLIISGKKRWLGPYSECEWAGLRCFEGSIVELQLNNLGLKGTIPAEIHHLGSLNILYTLDNSISGQIPSEIGKLDLIALDLKNNNLSGEVPTELYRLTSLQYLNIGMNKLNGTLSTNVGGFQYLKGLHLAHNRFNGTIPSEIGKLGKTLDYLTINDNKFNQRLPTELESLTNLKLLFVDTNQFTGELVVPIADDLTTLSISRNEFSALPENLFKLKNLEYILADSNRIKGPLSSQIGNLTKLAWLLLKENQLYGTIPQEIKNLRNLEYLRLHRNNFSGAVDSEICDLFSTNLVQFYADCKNDLDIDALPEVECPCCTDCCDPGPKGQCSKQR